MLTSCYPRLRYGRWRNDLLDLDGAIGSLTIIDPSATTQWLIEAGFTPCHREPDHWIVSRGAQHIHLYGEAELSAFARRYRPNHAPVALSDTTPEEIDS
ncbi:hypothetical protein [Marinobacter mangrovi]|uniref:hypothetical protein n=1 Tax=Marinobacter mangrovi TaxID=2803918 RepID=UPI0019317226|nr:hypothetical protein [Marinobacter mangrovi]